MQMNFLDKCVDWIARDCRSVTIVEGQGFCELISFMNTRYQSITRDVRLRRMKKRESIFDEKLLSRIKVS